MDFITRYFSQEYYVQWIEILTIAAILVALGYVFYTLNVFKKN